MMLEAYDLARALDVPLIEADALSWRGLMSILAGDVAEGTGLISQATALIEEHELFRLVTSAHPITAQALAHALRQETELARTTWPPPGASPWPQRDRALVPRLWPARPGADRALPRRGAPGRMLISEARAGMTPELAGSLAMDILESTEELLADAATQASSLAPLTPAEMRVLQFLPSHLTFRQIGEHLFLSATTVKTHALADLPQAGRLLAQRGRLARPGPGPRRVPHAFLSDPRVELVTAAGFWLRRRRPRSPTTSRRSAPAACRTPRGRRRTGTP